MKSSLICISFFILSLSTLAQKKVYFYDNVLKSHIKSVLGLSTTHVYEEDMLALQKLNINDSRIGNLKGLEFAHNLKEITCVNSDLIESSFQILGSLHKLEKIDISFTYNKYGSNYINPSFINNLENLIYLNLEGVKIDYSKLNPESLEKISHLNLLKTRMRPEHLSLLKRAINLDSLFVYDYISFINENYSRNTLCYDSIYSLAEHLPKLSYENLVGDERLYYNSKSLKIGHNYRINATQIDSIAPFVYELSGDIFTNNHPQLRFKGTKVTVNLNEDLRYPELSGNGKIYFGSQTLTNLIEDNIIADGEFLFYATVNSDVPSLKVQQPIETPLNIEGIPLKICEISEYSYKSNKTFAQFTLSDLPFPFQDAFDHIRSKYGEFDYYYLPSDIKGGKVYGLNLSSEYDISFSLSDLDMNSFKLDDIYFSLSSSGNSSARFSLSIPGSGLESILKSNNLEQETCVDFIHSNGDTVQISPAQLTSQAQAFGAKLLEVKVNAEIKNGGIDKFILSSNADIPIGTTGLKITEITGGVEDFTGSNWKIIANVDIKTALELPVVGEPIKINDFGIKVAPMTEFEGSGGLEVFGSDAANGKLSYNYEKGIMEVSSSVNIAKILTGNMQAKLTSTSLVGTISGQIQTPENLPWGFGWAANTKLSSVKADLNNYTIKTKGQIWKLTLAQRIEFGNPSFPYVYYSIGSNYDNLYKILKSTSKAYEVAPGTQEILFIAGTDETAIDFEANSPSGEIFTKNNTDYETFHHANQTVMRITTPEPGVWEIIGDTDNDFSLEGKVLNPGPVASWQIPNEPIIIDLNQKQIDPIVYLDYFDGKDKINIRWYVDNDNHGFDGTEMYYQWNRNFHTNLDSIGTAEMALLYPVWRAIPYTEPGDYYLYVTIDDGKNFPTKLYSPFKIQYKSLDLEIFKEKPSITATTILNDSLKVSWQYNPNYHSQLFYKTRIGNNVNFVDKIDTSFCNIPNIRPNVDYQIWIKYTQKNGDASSAASDTVSFNLADSLSVSPLKFYNKIQEYIFIAGQEKQYTFDISSRTDANISYELHAAIKEIQLIQNTLSWTPKAEDIGYHNVSIVATDSVFSTKSILIDSTLINDEMSYNYVDSTSLDTIFQDTLVIVLVVRSADQFNTKISFATFFLQESSINVINVFDFGNRDEQASVEITNSKTEQILKLNCNRSDNLFTGAFYLNSEEHKNSINVEIGDTIWATYNNGEKTFRTFAVHGEALIKTSKKNLSKLEPNKMSIYPNPSNDFITVTIKDKTPINNITIFDAFGQKVLYRGYTPKIGINHLPHGIYKIQITCGEQQYISSFIKK